MRDELHLISSAEETQALAESVPDNGGVYLVSAFTGLGAPYWDMYARGTLVGITRGTTRAHVVRAGLEGIAYQVRDLIDAMEKDVSGGRPPLSHRPARYGGDNGARRGVPRRAARRSVVECR